VGSPPVEVGAEALWHIVNPICPLDMAVKQLTPVTVPIRFKIKKEKKTKSNPAIAKVMDFLAVSTVFASPPDKINLIPERMIIITATAPEKISSQKNKLASSGGRSPKVDT
jgi:hypothetical protein